MALPAAAVANPSERRCGDVGQGDREEAGDVGRPFWLSRRLGTHCSILATAMPAGAEALMMIGWRGGRGRRWNGRRGAPVRGGARGGGGELGRWPEWLVRDEAWWRNTNPTAWF
jgi:hypothetical protein